MSSTVTVTGPNGPTQVHAAGCADLMRGELRRNQSEHWTLSVDSVQELAEEIWGDVATDTTESGTPEWAGLCLEFFEGEYRIMPCVTPAIPATAEVVA